MGDFNANLLTTSVDETYLRDVTSELPLKVGAWDMDRCYFCRQQ